jgi:hypothetical protein
MPDPVKRHRRLVLGGGAGLPPLAAGATSWLFEAATSGDQLTWERQIGNHDATATAGREPTAQADSSLLFTAATPDVMAWEISGANFSTDYLAIYFWFKPTAVATNQTLCVASIGTNGASARSFSIMSAGAALRVDLYASGTNGRRHTFNSFFSAGVSRMVGFEFNKDGSGDARLAMTKDAVVQTPNTIADLTGTPATPSILVNVTGRILFGNFNNSAVASDPVGGRYGRSLVARSGSKMSAATEGVLTQGARDALFAFSPLA